jgi:ADP-ribose pyrophosphatase
VKLDQGEAPEKCVERELKEETGYTANKIRKIATIGTTMAFSNEVIHLYIAEDLVEGEACPDEDEFINVEKYTKEELHTMIKDGTIDDAKSLVAILMANI